MSDVAALLAQLTGRSEPAADPALAAVKLARATIDALVLRMGQSIDARVTAQLAGGLTQLTAGSDSFVLKLETPLPINTAVTVKVAATPSGQPAVTVTVQPPPVAAQPALPAPLPTPSLPQPPAAAPPPMATAPQPTAVPVPPILSSTTPAPTLPPTSNVAPPTPAPLPTTPFQPATAPALPLSQPSASQAPSVQPQQIPLPPTPATIPAPTAPASLPPATLATAANIAAPAQPTPLAPTPTAPATPPIATPPSAAPTAPPPATPAPVPQIATTTTLPATPQPPPGVSMPAPPSPQPATATPLTSPSAAPVATAATAAPTPSVPPTIAAAPAPAVPAPAPPATTPSPTATSPSPPPPSASQQPPAPQPPAPPPPAAQPLRPSAPPPTSPPLSQILADPVQAAARQDSAAPLLARLAALNSPTIAALPRPVLEAIVRVLAGRLDLNRAPPDGKAIRDAVLRAGVISEAGARSPADAKSALLQLRSALTGFLGGEVEAIAPVTRRPPPPLKGEPPRASAPQPAPSQPEEPLETARQLLGHTDATLSRLKLLQLASNPAEARPNTPVPATEFRVEVPMQLGAETGILQLLVERDGKHKATPRERGWRMRFALNFTATGEVGAEIALLGRSANVALWAAEPATADALEAMLPDLAPALARHGLEVGAVRVRRGVPPPPARAPGRLLDSAR